MLNLKQYHYTICDLMQYKRIYNVHGIFLDHNALKLQCLGLEYYQKILIF